MKFYSFLTNPEEFYENQNPNDRSHPFEWHIPKDNASIESVCSALEFAIACADDTDTIVYDKKKLIDELIKQVALLDWYKHKTELEQQEVIKYIQENTVPDNPFID